MRDLLRPTALDDADARVAVELARDPDRADAWYCRGIIANRRRDHANAIAALRRAIALRPDAALAWLALGTAFSRGSEWSEATDAYGRAIEHEPSWADAHLNLGLARKQLGDNEGALRAFHAAWVRDPMLTEAARQCVAAIADDVTHDPDTADFAERDEPAPLHPSFTVVVCSIDAAKQTRAVALYRRLFADFPHEIVAVTNPRSLAEAYNQAAQASRADIVLMSHDDVDVIAPDFASRIARLLATRADALGVIGATRLDGPAVGWSGHPNLRGWIVHRDGDETGWRLDVLDHRPFADGVEILDGVVMAARRDVLRAVPFDAVTFDGFHLYHLDWSHRVARAGFRVGVCGELIVVHASRGSYGAEWERRAARFCALHGVGRGEPKPSSFAGATLNSLRQVRAFFARLSSLAEGVGDPLAQALKRLEGQAVFGL